MARIPIKIETRIKSNLTKYGRILKKQRDKDINEADTVRVVTRMLTDMMGYDEYSEITAEYQHKGTYRDLAIKIGDTIHFIIEVKSIGSTLKDSHLQQAVDYAANQGIDWVMLTNGVNWEVHKVIFKKPISFEKVFALDFTETTPRNKRAIEQIFSICREGVSKDILGDVHEERRVTNRHTIANLILSDPVLKAIKREIRKMSKGVRIEDAQLLDILTDGVLKRDVVEGEKVKVAQALIKKRMRKANRIKEKETPKPKVVESQPPSVPPPPPPSY